MAWHAGLSALLRPLRTDQPAGLLSPPCPAWHQVMMQWREQIDRQVAAQQKQVDRMEFALNKSRNDAAYMTALKELMHGDM